MIKMCILSVAYSFGQHTNVHTSIEHFTELSTLWMNIVEFESVLVILLLCSGCYHTLKAFHVRFREGRDYRDVLKLDQFIDLEILFLSNRAEPESVSSSQNKNRISNIKFPNNTRASKFATEVWENFDTKSFSLSHFLHVRKIYCGGGLFKCELLLLRNIISSSQ